MIIISLLTTDMIVQRKIMREKLHVRFKLVPHCRTRTRRCAVSQIQSSAVSQISWCCRL